VSSITLNQERLKKHYHDAIEVAYVVKGSCKTHK